MHLLLSEGEAVPGGQNLVLGRHDDVVVEVAGLHPGFGRDRIQMPVERGLLAVRELVVVEG